MHALPSGQYLALVAVDAVVSFSVARVAAWDLGDSVVTVGTVVLAIALFSALVFCLR